MPQNIAKQISESNSLSQLPKMPGTFRAFFAVAIPTDLQGKITALIKPLKSLKICSTAKWCKAENLHITLRFLGNINVEQHNAIVMQVAEKLCNTPAFTVDITALRLFPDLQTPHALILKPHPLVKLIELSLIIDKVVLANGVQPDNKPFVPHLTLARFKNKLHLSSEAITNLTMDNLLEMHLPINEVILYRSNSGGLESQYIELHKFTLPVR